MACLTPSTAFTPPEAKKLIDSEKVVYVTVAETLCQVTHVLVVSIPPSLGPHERTHSIVGAIVVKEASNTAGTGLQEFFDCLFGNC